jgi:hypothetical protein
MSHANGPNEPKRSDLVQVQAEIAKRNGYFDPGDAAIVLSANLSSTLTGIEL